MIETQFLLINTHFTLYLLSALVCFAVTWLYFDAWLGRKDQREFTKFTGFLLLSISFVIKAVTIDQSILQDSIFTGATLTYATAVFRAAGYIVLILGQLIDPLQPLPSYRKGGFGIKNTAKAAIIGVPLSISIIYTYPLLAALTGFLYIRRATLGLEFHLRSIGYSFFLLSISEFIALGASFRGTSNVDLKQFVGAFGPLWIAERVVLVAAMFILGRWVWGYLIKRLETQLFMIFTSTTLIIFLLTAIFFTSVSLVNLRQDTLKSLEINVSVLNFTIESKKDETLSDAQILAQNSEVVSAIKDSSFSNASEIATELLLAKTEASIIITSDTGEILVRAEEPEKVGGSLSNNPLVERALTGEDTKGLATKDGVVAPIVSVQAATPIYDNGEIIGSVLVANDIDNAFVDGLKEATGLDASIYGDNVRSATTFVAPDGKSRYIGIKEETDTIQDKVLNDGELYVGNVSILNVPYLAAFTPIKDVNDNPVGMLFVGRPQIETVQAISQLMEQTFFVTAALLIISIFPSYFISRYIIFQVNT